MADALMLPSKSAAMAGMSDVFGKAAARFCKATSISLIFWHFLPILCSTVVEGHDN